MDFRRLFDLFLYQQIHFPQGDALAERREMGWRGYSTDECIAAVNRVSAGFLRLGLERGDRVALLADRGSPRWNFLDLGLQQIGVVVVSVPAAVTASELEYILRETKARCCIADSRPCYDRAAAISAQLLHLKALFPLDDSIDRPGWSVYTCEPSEKHLETIQGLRAAIHEDDLATIAYAPAGGKGVPQGVMLSHKNIIGNIKAVVSLLPFNCDKRVLSLIPQNQPFGRMAIYTAVALGASVYFRSREQPSLEAVREVAPHFLIASPRLLTGIHDGIMERARGLPLLRRRIVLWAVALGKSFREDRPMSLWYWMRNRIADGLVYRRWRTMLGGRLEGVVIGGASLSPETGRLFSAAGIEVREGYGLPQTATVITFNRFEPGGVRFGTAGRTVPGVKIKIEAPDERGCGEILVKGPNVMMGYYRPPRAALLLTSDGWLKTGVSGRIVDGGFLEVTGRAIERRQTAGTEKA